MSPSKFRLKVLFIGLIFLHACGKFQPLTNSIQTTSDGTYAIESTMNDSQLTQIGYQVIYRFQSVPNLIAVRQLKPLSNIQQNPTSAKSLQNLIQNNQKSILNREKSSLKISQNTCLEAYCEAGFDKTLTQFQSQLVPVKVAIIDSGVFPVTSSIQNALISSLNLTNITDNSSWISHATMISSLLTGVLPNQFQQPEIYAPNAQINSIKINLSSDAESNSEQKYGSMQFAVALDTAISSGAKVVNLSLEYETKPDDNIQFVEKGIMSAGANKGVYFIVAAGNDGTNLDTNPKYPASYGLKNLIVVGSHNSLLNKASSSNFGKTVDLSAQGVDVVVNNKNGGVEMQSGTSFATPMVVSALCIYLGLPKNTNKSMDTTLQNLYLSANTYSDPSQNNINSNYGRLNVYDFVTR